MRKEPLLAATLLFLGIQPVALGQSMNVDLGAPGGSAPSSSFAAAGRAGFWNFLPGGGVIPARDLAGLATNVLMGANSASGQSAAIGGPSAEDNNLMSDFVRGAIDLSPSVDILGLKSGEYRVLVYAWGGVPGADPHLNFTDIVVTAGNTTVSRTLLFNSTWPRLQIEGITFAQLRLFVEDGDALSISVTAPVGNENQNIAIIQGFQLVLVPAPTSAALLIGCAVAAARRRR
jgi:hypothetical protein